MTLKELITKVDFDSLLPYLEKREEEKLDNIYAFREAYDILRDMEPAPDYRGEIHVIRVAGESDDEEEYVRVCYMDDAGWDEDLAKEIVMDDGISLNSAKLAMYCLWEITYWGFSPEERDKTWQEKSGPKKLSNPYEVALDKLEESIRKHQTPRRLRSKGQRYVSSVFYLKMWKSRKNRAKRKREYRQNKRKKYLYKMAARENLVRMLSAEGSSFRRNDVEFLLNVQYGTRYDYNSVTHGAGARLGYIAESMTKYQQLDLSGFDSAVVFIRHSRPYQLDNAELESFQQAVRKRLGYNDILFGTAINDEDNPEVSVTLLLNRK